MFPSLIAILTLAACNKDPVDPNDTNDPKTKVEDNYDPDARLSQFQDCSEMRGYLAEVMTNVVLNNRYSYWYFGLDESAESSPSEDGGGNSSEPTDYTTTNVQEEGVDELDISKTDGQYIYYIDGKRVHIVDSWPVEDTHKVAEIEIDGWGQKLFLKDDKLVVFSSIYSYYYGESDVESSITDGTRIIVYDITDRSNPVEVQRFDINGYLADGRMIEDDIYLVLNNYMYLPSEIWDLTYDEDLNLPEVDWDLPEEEMAEHLEELKAEARVILEPLIGEYVEDMNLDEYLPMMESNGTLSSLHTCENLFRPDHASQLSILSVVNLDLENEDFSSTSIISDGWTIYASQENLYVAQSGRWWWNWGDDNPFISHIHKFSLNGGEIPQYVGSGEVSGWLYDQFAMSEWDGHLRVASTNINWWWGWNENTQEEGNNLTVLQDNNEGELVVTGSITGIAPGERIFASRMFGAKGYMVTFEQIDPLFTIDLSDHSNPTLVGELKIPGYSSYLHALGEDHLLAVGMDGDMDGNLTGLAVNIFDVSDFANPMLAHQYTLDEGDGWAWSEALWDHHAFTFHRDVLSIPAYTYDWDESTGYYTGFSGLISFSIDTEDGIEELGRVDHQDLVSDSECIYSIWYEYDYECYYYDWRAQVRRSIYIEDNVFSLSTYGVKVNDLNDPETEIASLPFYPSEE